SACLLYPPLSTGTHLYRASLPTRRSSDLMLTLLGGSEEPGMLEGTIPIPAAMARELAGESEAWYRVLTDPCSGAFLPLPAQRYTPTRAMLEHLRLRKIGRASCRERGEHRAAGRP